MYMRNKRKLLLSILSMLMVFSLLAACGGGKEAQTEPPKTNTEQPTTENTTPEAETVGTLGKEPLSFTLYGHYDWYTMPEWGKDISSAWIKENKLVDIKPIQSGGNAAQKLQTMIAGNNLPDVVWGERVDVDRLREAGMLVALDDYMEKYPNLKKWLDSKAANMLRSPDGKLYQIPNWYTSRPNGNAGYVVNKKIYTELGSPKLETTDDLYAYLKQVKEKYPDVVPFETGQAKDGQGLDQLYSAFKEDNRSYTRYYSVPEGDKLVSIYKDEAFREASVYTAKLFREKLITQDAMTQTEDQLKEKLMNGKVAVFASADPMKFGMQAHAELTKNDPDGGYFMIWPIHKEGLDKNKIYPGSYNMLGWNVAVITTSAKNPEAIFEFLDWYTGPEGSGVMMWGPPSEDGYWTGFQDDGVTPNFTAKYGSDAEALAKHQGETSDLMWVGNTVFIDDNKGKFELTLPEDQRNWATNWQYQVTWKTQGDATEFINLNPVTESEEGIIRQRLLDIWEVARAKALFAASDEEVLKILDKAHDDSMAAGFQTYLDYITNRWHENLKLING